MVNNNLTDMLSLIDKIGARVVLNQALNVELQEALNNTKQDLVNTLDHYSLAMIELLDFLERIKLLEETDPLIIIAKLSKKLRLLLANIGVQEISVDCHKIDGSLHRILDTVPASQEVEIGDIVAVCRPGYTRLGRIIRLVDVITAK